MRKPFLLILFSLLVSGIKAQNKFGCTSQEFYTQQMDADPLFRKNQEQLEMETAQFMKDRALGKAASATYIIPVVFHIIHTGGTGNISDAQILDQMVILNKEFLRQQADTALAPAVFKNKAAPFNVEFRLATKDPDGNCTNGINRIYNSLSECSLYENDVKAISYWPSNKYLNIWLTESMHYSGNTDCNGGGYASFPGGAPTLDGINIRGDLISNIGTSATNSLWGNFKGRYLIHELGHWFNLRHIWGDMICGNDQVSDTPPAVTSNSGCPVFPHNPFNTCGGDGNGEMFNNYMDYSEGTCLNMFTAGQVARMTAAINSSISGRNNLWSSSNLIATGVNDPYQYPADCPAVPEIFPYGTIIACVGDSVKITDRSYSGQQMLRYWDFFGAPSSSLSDSIVKVVYNAPGYYSIGLTNEFLSSVKSATFVNKVYVLDPAPNPAYVVPFVDELESVSAFANDWNVINRDNDSTTWEHTLATSYSGFYSAALYNFGKSAPMTDDLISPPYDLTYVENAKLNFRLHFAGRIPTNNDRLQVFISNNCGASWSSIYSSFATGNLKTVGTTYSVSHIPDPASSEWRLEKVNILPFLATGIVRFKFTFTSGGGNNIFLDDINVLGDNSAGIENYFFDQGVRMFPNPVKDELTLSCKPKENSPVTVEVSDMLGKICLTTTIDGRNLQDYPAKIKTGRLDNGLYLLRMQQDGATIYTAKFTRESSQ